MHEFWTLLICILQSIPPVARIGMDNGKWVTVLCRKLKDWWHLVCDLGIVKIFNILGVVLHLVDELKKALSSGCRRQPTNHCLTWVSSVPKQFLGWIPCYNWILGDLLFFLPQSGNWNIQGPWASDTIIDPESNMWHTLWGVCPYYSRVPFAAIHMNLIVSCYPVESNAHSRLSV